MTVRRFVDGGVSWLAGPEMLHLNGVTKVEAHLDTAGRLDLAIWVGAQLAVHQQSMVVRQPCPPVRRRLKARVKDAIESGVAPYKLDSDLFSRDDVVEILKDLLGDR